jgi:ribosome-associated protein
MTPLQLSRLITRAAEDKKARDVIRLDVREQTSIADYFVICEGDTDRQVRAISDGIVRTLKEHGVRPFQTAGYEQGSWVVLDYSTVIVHVFLPGERAYYDLESLWRRPRRDAQVKASRNGGKLAAARPARRRMAR